MKSKLLLFSLLTLSSSTIGGNIGISNGNITTDYLRKCTENEQIVKITTTKLQTGSPIETSLSNDETYEYKWFVNEEDTGITTSSYTPTARDYESWIKVSILKDNQEISSDKIYFSSLPVAYINTDSGNDIDTRDYYVNASMKIQGNYQYDSQYDGKIEIKGRGTASWHYDKKPYKIKLDKKTNLFGFGKNKHFVLLANYLDPSELRNTVGYKMGKAFGLVSNDTEWINVILNGELRGLYQITEHIRVGSQLVDIFDYEGFAGDMADALASEYPDTIKKA